MTEASTSASMKVQVFSWKRKDQIEPDNDVAFYHRHHFNKNLRLTKWKLPGL